MATGKDWEDGTMYILMEYADAGDLFSAVKCGGLRASLELKWSP